MWVPHSPEQRARESGPADPSAATHGMLTVVGMLPIIGIPFNVADGIYSAAQGDKTGAVLSFAGAIPGIGDESDAAKLARLGAKGARETIDASTLPAEQVANLARYSRKAAGSGQRATDRALTRRVGAILGRRPGSGPRLLRPVRQVGGYFWQDGRLHQGDLRREWGSRAFEEQVWADAVNGPRREELLRELIAGRSRSADITSQLAAFGWDSDAELVSLSRTDALTIVERYLRDEASAEAVREWADAVEAREDIGYEQGAEEVLSNFIFELANPEITRPLTQEVALNWKSRLRDA